MTGRYFKRGGPRRAINERFWEKVAKSGPDDCWLWLARTQSEGYGVIGLDAPSRRSVLTHRLSWEMANGPIPDGLFVCHHCDVRSCVNPRHLFLGTQFDNMGDAARKGRTSRVPRVWGDSHPKRKLSSIKVLEIRQAHALGETQKALAKEHGVSVGVIHAVVHRKTWRSVLGLMKAGALWVKTGSKGEYLSGIIEPKGRGGPSYRVLVFPNEKENDKQPDWRVMMDDGQDDKKKVSEAVEDTTPF